MKFLLLKWPVFRRRRKIEVDRSAVLFEDIELYAEWRDATAQLSTNMGWWSYRVARKWPGLPSAENLTL